MGNLVEKNSFGITKIPKKQVFIRMPQPILERVLKYANDTQQDVMSDVLLELIKDSLTRLGYN